jgi:hypothetical protein
VWRIDRLVGACHLHIPEIELPRLAHPDGMPASANEIADYVRRNVSFCMAMSPACAARMCARLRRLPVIAASRRRSNAPDARSMRIHSSAFFPIVPTHVTYAQVVTEDGEFISQLLTADQQTLSLSNVADKSPLQDASFLQYIAMGIDHIFTGYDHQAFLLALVLLSSRLRDLIFVVTGFTVGHSISLSSGGAGIVRPHAEFIDSLVGLTIALIAAENIADSAHRRGTIALAFGGIMLAFALASFAGCAGCRSSSSSGGDLRHQLHDDGGLHPRRGAAAAAGDARVRHHPRIQLCRESSGGEIAHGTSRGTAVGFNLGVEIGQLAVVAAILSVVAIWCD